MGTSAEDSPHPDSIVRKLIHGGGAAFAGKLLTYPLGLILAMIFTRLLSKADVGGYFLALSLAMLASGIVQLGLPIAMSKHIARSLAQGRPGNISSIIRIGAVSFAAASAVTVVLVGGALGNWLIGRLSDGAPLEGTMHLVAWLIVAFVAVNYCCEILRGFNRLPAAALLDQQLLQRILLLIALLLALFVGVNLALADILAWTSFSAFAAAAAGLLMIARSVRNIDGSDGDFAAIQLFREAPAFLLIRVNNWILNGAAVWVLGFVRPLDETAMFGAANIVALLTIAAWQVVSSAIGPTVVTLHAISSKTVLQSLLHSSAAIGALPGLLLMLILAFWGEYVLEVLFTEDYAGAAGILVILAVGRSLATLFGSPMTLLSMTNHQGVVRNILAIISVLTLVCYGLVAQSSGAMGVAYVTAASAIAQGVIFAFLARHLVHLDTTPRLSRTNWRQLVALLSGK